MAGEHTEKPHLTRQQALPIRPPGGTPSHPQSGWATQDRGHRNLSLNETGTGDSENGLVASKTFNSYHLIRQCHSREMNTRLCQQLHRT